MAVISSQQAYSVGLGGVYTKSFSYVNAVMTQIPAYSSRVFQGFTNMVMPQIPVYSNRFILFNPGFLPAASQVYPKALFASTEVDTMTSSLYKPILNGGTIGNLSFDAKYIAAGPISEPIRPLYGVLWPKGHK
jgi:hypothetical protein